MKRAILRRTGSPASTPFGGFVLSARPCVLDFTSSVSKLVIKLGLRNELGRGVGVVGERVEMTGVN